MDFPGRNLFFTTIVKNSLRPGKLSQAKPYAAKAAIRMGMIVAGTATATEFRNAVLRLLPWRMISFPSASLKVILVPVRTFL